MAATPWALRRGILELDLILCRYWQNGYSCLSDGGKAGFAELLLQEDLSLMAWIDGRSECPLKNADEALEGIRRMIRGKQLDYPAWYA